MLKIELHCQPGRQPGQVSQLHIPLGALNLHSRCGLCFAVFGSVVGPREGDAKLAEAAPGQQTLVDEPAAGKGTEAVYAAVGNAGSDKQREAPSPAGLAAVHSLLRHHVQAVIPPMRGCDPGVVSAYIALNRAV
jgi:hypothetical protein